MAKKQLNIKCVSYVHSKDGGLIAFDDLTEEQKRSAATQIECTFLNAFYAGRYHFRPANEEVERT